MKYDNHYINIANLVAGLSRDPKTRVGCVVVRDGQILSQGYNGTPPGDCNCTRDDAGNTLPTVIHSEANALMKLARNGGGANEATLFSTHSPCFTCACLIIQAGIRRVVYEEVYEQEAIDYLKERGISIEGHIRIPHTEGRWD